MALLGRFPAGLWARPPCWLVWKHSALWVKAAADGHLPWDIVLFHLCYLPSPFSSCFWWEHLGNSIFHCEVIISGSEGFKSHHSSFLLAPFPLCCLLHRLPFPVISYYTSSKFTSTQPLSLELYMFFFFFISSGHSSSSQELFISVQCLSSCVPQLLL